MSKPNNVVCDDESGVCRIVEPKEAKSCCSNEDQPNSSNKEKSPAKNMSNIFKLMDSVASVLSEKGRTEPKDDHSDSDSEYSEQSEQSEHDMWGAYHELVRSHSRMCRVFELLVEYELEH